MKTTFKSKISHWLHFTINCFKTRNPFIRQAWELTNLSYKAFELIGNSGRTDIWDERYNLFMPPILGMYFTVTGFHSTVQTLALSGYGQNSWLIVRPQLESLMIFLYFTESYNDFNEIENRVSQYTDWVIVKMNSNMEHSSLFPIITRLSSHKEFEKTVRQNYEILKKRYENCESELRQLKKSASFLQDKPAIARRHNIEDLYYHIQSESSASLHIADLSDRMEIKTAGSSISCIYNTNIEDADWAMMLSNLLQYNLINKFSKFFDLQDTVMPVVKKVFQKNLA